MISAAVAASAAVAVARAGAARASADSGSTCFCAMPNPPSVVGGGPAIQPTPIVPPRRTAERQGMDEAARPAVRLFAVLPHPEGEAAD